MTRSILITGVAGSGKTTICEELTRQGYPAISLEDIKELFIMRDKETKEPITNLDNDDLEAVEKTEWICNKKKLQELIKKTSGKLVFYAGIASNLDDLLPLFEEIVLLKASNETLRKRLSTRTNNDYARTEEVQKRLFDWKDSWEAHMIEKGAYVVNANQKLEQITQELISHFIEK